MKRAVTVLMKKKQKKNLFISRFKYCLYPKKPTRAHEVRQRLLI